MLSSWPSWLCLVRRPYLLNYMSNSTEIFCVDRFVAGLGTGQISAQSDEKRLRSRVFHLTFTCFIRRSKGCTVISQLELSVVTLESGLTVQVYMYGRRMLHNSTITSVGIQIQCNAVIFELQAMAHLVLFD